MADGNLDNVIFTSPLYKFDGEVTKFLDYNLIDLCALEGRVFAVHTPATAELPYVFFQREGYEPRPVGDDDCSGVINVTFSCCAADAEAARRLAQAVCNSFGVLECPAVGASAYSLQLPGQQRPIPGGDPVPPCPGDYCYVVDARNEYAGDAYVEHITMAFRVSNKDRTALPSHNDILGGASTEIV